MQGMNSGYFETLSRIGRDARLVIGANGFFSFGIMGLFNTVLNLYLLRLGYGPEYIGLVNALIALSFAPFALPAAALGAKWGYRRVMIVGVFCTALGYGLIPLGEMMPPTWRSVWIATAACVAGCCLPFFIVNGTPFLSSSTNGEERGHAFSVRIALESLAGFSGSLAGGLIPSLYSVVSGVSLAAPGPYRWALVAGVALFLPAVLLLHLSREPERGQTEPGAHKQADSRPSGSAPVALIAMLTLVMFAFRLGQGSSFTFFNVYLDDGMRLSAAGIGAIRGVGLLIAIPASLSMPLIAARLKKHGTILAAMITFALCLVVLGLLRHWLAALLAFAVLRAAFAVHSASYTVYSQEIVEPRRREVMSGSVLMAAGLGIGIISITGGFIIRSFDYRTLFLAAAGLVLVGAAIFGVYFRRPRGEYTS